MSQYLKNPTSCQSGHCFICSTEIVKTNMNSHMKKCERFCILVGRYLNLNIENNSKSRNFKFDFKSTLGKRCGGNEPEFICCESCFVEVEILCVVFEQFSLIQVELNTRLDKISQLIKNRNLCHEKNEALQRKPDYVEKFRNAVVSGIQKGYKNFPRLQLTNLTRDLTTNDATEPIRIQLHQENSNAVTKGLIIKEETEKTSWKPRPKLNSKNLPFKCRICGNGFAKKLYKEKHEKRHLKPHNCRFCGRRFTNKITLDTHEKLHTDIASTSQFMCCVCKKSFLRMNDCKVHITKAHNKVGKVLQIMQKPKSDTDAELPLPSSNVSTGHFVDKRNTHRIGSDYDKGKIIKKGDDDDKPFKCLICGKGFSQRQPLLKHQVVHNEARPYKCPYCEQAFKHSQVLATHKRIHFGIKPFQCGLCGVTFARSTHCRAHQKRIHHITDGVIIRNRVNIPNETETSPNSSAPVVEGFLFNSNDNAGAEGRKQIGHNGLHSMKAEMGDSILPAMIDGVEVEESEPHIIFPKSEPFEHLNADLCDPLANV